MTDRSRQDRTRSPRPNRLALLYQYRDEIEFVLQYHKRNMKFYQGNLRDIDREIKRACGDRETI